MVESIQYQWFHSQFRTFEEVQKSQYYGVGLEIGL